MRMFKWSPEFRSGAESTVAPIWVNFPYLPIHFFSKQNLFSIGRTLGAPLKMDAATAILDRPSVARMCIEMDLLKMFPSRIWIGCGNNGFWQEVIYEKIPKYCLTCLKQGHNHKNCKIKKLLEKI